MKTRLVALVAAALLSAPAWAQQKVKLATSMGFQVAFAVAGAAYLLSALAWRGIPDTQGRELE